MQLDVKDKITIQNTIAETKSMCNLMNREKQCTCMVTSDSSVLPNYQYSLKFIDNHQLCSTFYRVLIMQLPTIIVPSSYVPPASNILFLYTIRPALLCRVPLLFPAHHFFFSSSFYIICHDRVNTW